MAAIASFSVARENGFRLHAKTDNANRLADPENLYIPDFKGIMRKKNCVKKKKISHQVGASLKLGGKLKI